MKERILWLDCLKGFAILLVVLGHCIHTMTGLYSLTSRTAALWANLSQTAGRQMQ